MKDSGIYSKKLLKLFSSLKKDQKLIKEPEYTDPVESVVYAIISEHSSLKDAKSAMKKIESHFVDFNDLRVSRAEEIIEIIGFEKEPGMKVANDLSAVLNAVFDRYDTISLEGLFEVGKRQARKELEELDCFSKFVIDYCFLTALKGHSIPTTEKMFEYLREKELVHPSADEASITGFLERQISSNEGYTFYHLLREESESPAGKTTSKSSKATSKKTVKKTTKKTATAKTTAKKKTVKKKS